LIASLAVTPINTSKGERLVIASFDKVNMCGEVMLTPQAGLEGDFFLDEE
jgi:hypothetical protein